MHENMFHTVQFLFLSFVHLCYCDTPQSPSTTPMDQIPMLPKIDIPELNNQQPKQPEVDLKAGQYYQGDWSPIVYTAPATLGATDDWDMEGGIGKLRLKLEKTLNLAQTLANTLQDHIALVSAREQVLKDVISNGRHGVTTVKVSTMLSPPREYTVRDGAWARCHGDIQAPVRGHSRSLFNELFSTPKCIGKEVATKRDPCSFNSIIKYETVPTYRGSEYSEDDILCLKPSFNSSLEQYLSVSKKTVDETCSNGQVRSLEENLHECGLRSMTEYTFYPDRSAAATNLPLEYCTEPDGSCKLVVAWHLSNATIENFEFLRNEPQFQQYFIKAATFI
ncbi:unnamed protein product [Plutella xylostella]|uniref:(diamondback moth) hypothetical protein n=1 Tax=Plutella xylostella TaxID=51655 RepID=A0A8S4DTC9_PLUXY|nr:unnamed protein product [Plutella xylostella]